MIVIYNKTLPRGRSFTDSANASLFYKQSIPIFFRKAVVPFEMSSTSEYTTRIWIGLTPVLASLYHPFRVCTISLSLLLC